MNAKKLASLLLSFVMAASLTLPALAEEPPLLIAARTPVPSVEAGDVVILHTNDIHAHIDGDIRYSHVAALKDYCEERGAYVVLVDSGDHIQGTAYGSMDKGKTIVELMNAAGYDLATLGNHEFDYGMQGMENALQWADYAYISCNFYHEKDGIAGDTVLEPYRIVEAGDRKLAFVGVTTPETFTSSTPAYFQNEAGAYIYGIAGGTDGQELYDAVQAAIDEIRQLEDIDSVYAIGHLGVDPSSQPWTSEEVLAHTDGIALFLDGHSHTQMRKDTDPAAGYDADLAQTGEYLSGIGMTILPENFSEAEVFLITADTLAAMDLQPDPEVQAMEEAWMAQVDTQLGEVIGYAGVTLDNYAADGTRLVRTQATNSGAFAADALYYLFDSMDMDVDVAVMNGGGIRNSALTGELSYKSMMELHPFGNVACLITVTGQQILDALEWGARDVGTAESGAFLHAAGLTYTIDSSIPSTVQQDDKGVWTGGPAGAYRVQDVKVLDQGTGTYVPLDVNAEYNLAGYNYTLRDLGDGFAMFDGAVNVLDYVMEDYMVLANYLRASPVDAATGLPTLSAGTSPAVGGITVDYSDLTMPGRITILQASAGTEQPAHSEPAAPAEPAAPVEPTAPAVSGGAAYVVTAGDCLWNIASKQLGRGARFGEIAALNGIADPYTIYIGQTLKLPAQ